MATFTLTERNVDLLPRLKHVGVGQKIRADQAKYRIDVNKIRQQIRSGAVTE